MRSRSVVALVVVACTSALLACSRSDSPPQATKEPSTSETASTTASPPVVAPVASHPAPLVLARGLRVVHAPDGADAAAVIRAERERAVANGRDVVVYIGAKWCEPCTRFHAAVERGDLDAEFPNLTLLEFDLDVDRDRLVAAGYTSELIPLFVVPDANGRATSKRFEGSVKGDRAVANIAPRLRAILTK